MEQSDQKKHQDFSDSVARCLERLGWLRSVAGSDFDLAVKGIVAASEARKGILFVGNPGVGKTYLMNILYLVYKGKYWLSCSNRNDLFKMQDTGDGFYLDKNVFIDDIGVESDEVFNYRKVNCFAEFIQWYYDAGGKGRIFGSTNLSSEEINNKYGGRVFDRLLSMCVIVKFSGKSKREKVVIK